MTQLSKKIAFFVFFCRRIYALVSIVLIVAGALGAAKTEAGSARDLL